MARPIHAAAEIRNLLPPAFEITDCPCESTARDVWASIAALNARSERWTVAVAEEYLVHGARCMEIHGNLLIGLRQPPRLSSQQREGMEVCGQRSSFI